MQIPSSLKTRSYQGQGRSFQGAQTDAEARKGDGILDRFSPKYDKLDVHLDQPEYKDINELEAANMLGHFTQTMQNAGYPWRLQAAESTDKGGYKKGEKISDFEALNRLKKGQAVLMQPMHDLQLDLSAGPFTAIAAASSVAATDTTGLTKVANYSKNAQVNAGSQGVSLKFGEPIIVEDFAQLKLLHQMYDPTDKIEGKSETAKAAHQFSYFTQKAVTSAFPWRFYVKDGSNTLLRVGKRTLTGTGGGALVGGIVGGVFGGLLGLAMGDVGTYALGGAAVGGTGGALKGGYDGLRTSLKGTPINAVEALENVLNDKEVYFQESRARSINVPIVGKISWFTDNGKASSINDPEQLNTFYYMQSQEDLPKPAKKEEKKKPEPQKPSVVMIDQSINTHHHHHHHHNHSHPTQVVVLEEQAPGPHFRRGY